MPSLKSSLIELSPERYRRIAPAPPALAPIQINPAPEPPVAIRRSPVMISSLPMSGGDSAARQFYGGPSVPTQRLMQLA